MPYSLVKNPLPLRLSPSIQGFKCQLGVKRLIIFGSNNFIQIIGCRVQTRDGVAIDASDAGIAALCEMVCCADAERASLLPVLVPLTAES